MFADFLKIESECRCHARRVRRKGDSKTSRCRNSCPGNVELLTDFGYQRIHTQRFRRVMSYIDDRDTAVGSIDCRPMWPFSNDQRVDAISSSFSKRLGRCA